MSGQGCRTGGSVGRSTHPAGWGRFEMLLRACLRWRGPDLHGKGPAALHGSPFVSCLCAWAPSGCVKAQPGRAAGQSPVLYAVQYALAAFNAQSDTRQ